MHAASVVPGIKISLFVSSYFIFIYFIFLLMFSLCVI